MAKRSKRKARTRRRALLLRWSLVAAAAFVAFLYYKPLSTYVHTRSSLNQRATEVRSLREEKTRLEARLADSATVAALAREARRMRLVRPGERLYIVRGIKEWRRAQAAKSPRATLPGNG